MRPPGKQDILIVITSPSNVEDPRDFSPFEAEEPEELVFTCFFRELEQRTEFLNRLRQAAGTPEEGAENPEAVRLRLAQEYARLMAEGQAGEAFFTVIRWWAGVLRRSYHAYSLKIGFAPFRTSCMVSFEELDTELVQYNLARGMQFLERERSRVLDTFGLPGMN